MMNVGATSNWGSLILHGVNPTGKEIGRGAYGRVFEVNYEGTLCAAKEVHALLLQYSHGNDLQKIKDDFLSECQIWSTLRHTCVVQFLGMVVCSLCMCISSGVVVISENAFIEYFQSAFVEFWSRFWYQPFISILWLFMLSVTFPIQKWHCDYY